MPPALERQHRRATVCCRDVERPAEMLARMAKPDTQAVMTADFVIERADIAELLGQRRRGFGNAGFETAAMNAGLKRTAKTQIWILKPELGQQLECGKMFWIKIECLAAVAFRFAMIAMVMMLKSAMVEACSRRSGGFGGSA